MPRSTGISTKHPHGIPNRVRDRLEVREVVARRHG